MNSTWYKIKEYKETFPNFLLYFNWAKHNSFFWSVYKDNKEDVWQEIALACVVGQTEKEINKLINRSVFKLWSAMVKDYIIPSPPRTKKYKCKPKQITKCDRCGRERFEYLRKSVLPNMKICAKCARQIWREDKKRNK
jgi:hypothetical protein